MTALTHGPNRVLHDDDTLDDGRRARAGPATSATAASSAPPSPGSKRSSSPFYRPQNVREDDDVYVLTLLTDLPHHTRMTKLRDQYFPRHLNKLEAHLTLFHALPATKLHESIIPALETIAARCTPFAVRADKVMRMKRGVGISVAKRQGAEQMRQLHARLRDGWMREGWLSEQDRGACHPHYTLMNKVDDEAEVLRAQRELEENFRSDTGVAEGFGLWRYDRGFWEWSRRFDFTAPPPPPSVDN